MPKCGAGRPLLGYGEEPYGQSPYGLGQPPENQPEFNPGPGYIIPTGTGNEANDRILHRLLQQIVSGITGMPGQTVFPRWQAEPVNQPNFDTDWAAVGIVGRTRETFAAVIHCTDCSTKPPTVMDTVYRNEILDVLCSFYGPGAESLSEVLAMGLMLEQNRYVMFLNRMALVDVGESRTVPELSKDRWLMKIDIPFRVRRQQAYSYPTANLKSMQGSLDAEVETIPISVTKD
jgi:hypothetical protein